MFIINLHWSIYTENPVFCLMYIRISCPDVLSNLHFVIMQDMYELRHRGLAKKGHAQPLMGTPKGLMLMVALPTLKDPPVGTLMEQMLMLALSTHKESLMIKSTHK